MCVSVFQFSFDTFQLEFNFKCFLRCMWTLNEMNGVDISCYSHLVYIHMLRLVFDYTCGVKSLMMWYEWWIKQDVNDEWMISWTRYVWWIKSIWSYCLIRWMHWCWWQWMIILSYNHSLRLLHVWFVFVIILYLTYMGTNQIK